MRLLLSLLALCLAAPAEAADISTYSFNSGMNCGGRWYHPDTGQHVHYSTAPGDDSHYNPAAVQPGYTVLNPVGVSSVTVDNVTGLIWVTNMVDAGVPYTSSSTWENALTLCEDLNYAGYTDWRLPDVRELASIVDFGKATAPRINTTYFLNTASGYYWISTTYAPLSTSAWVIDFNSGNLSTGVKTVKYYVKCVRAGPY